jgi:hypothetical protein
VVSCAVSSLQPVNINTESASIIRIMAQPF